MRVGLAGRRLLAVAVLAVVMALTFSVAAFAQTATPDDSVVDTDTATGGYDGTVEESDVTTPTVAEPELEKPAEPADEALEFLLLKGDNFDLMLTFSTITLRLPPMEEPPADEPTDDGTEPAEGGDDDAATGDDETVEDVDVADEDPLYEDALVITVMRTSNHGGWVSAMASSQEFKALTKEYGLKRGPIVSLLAGSPAGKIPFIEPEEEPTAPADPVEEALEPPVEDEPVVTEDEPAEGQPELEAEAPDAGSGQAALTAAAAGKSAEKATKAKVKAKKSVKKAAKAKKSKSAAKKGGKKK